MNAIAGIAAIGVALLLGRRKSATGLDEYSDTDLVLALSEEVKYTTASYELATGLSEDDCAERLASMSTAMFGAGKLKHILSHIDTDYVSASYLDQFKRDRDAAKSLIGEIVELNAKEIKRCVGPNLKNAIARRDDLLGMVENSLKAYREADSCHYKHVNLTSAESAYAAAHNIEELHGLQKKSERALDVLSSVSDGFMDDCVLDERKLPKAAEFLPLSIKEEQEANLMVSILGLTHQEATALVRRRKQRQERK